MLTIIELLISTIKLTIYDLVYQIINLKCYWDPKVVFDQSRHDVSSILTSRLIS